MTKADIFYFVQHDLYKHLWYLVVTHRTFPEGTSLFEGTSISTNLQVLSENYEQLLFVLSGTHILDVLVLRHFFLL